jgi:hypothetical protein
MLNKVLPGTCTLALFATLTHAANVTWQTPQYIAGASDVSTQGTYVGSWSPYIQGTSGANPMTVNGVTYQGNDLQSFSVPAWFAPGTGGGIYTGFGSPGTPDTNYNTLLGGAQYGADGAGTYFSFGGLTPGHSYLVQMWAEDTRNIGSRRWENFYDKAYQKSPINYTSEVSSNDIRQFVIGTFTANAATQTINQNTWSNVAGRQSGQVNRFQLRDTTPVPEPASLGMLVAGGVMMLRRSRGR